jgi:hypothetical protein
VNCTNFDCRAWNSCIRTVILCPSCGTQSGSELSSSGPPWRCLLSSCGSLRIRHRPAALSVVYQAGDAILLKRGCVWSEPGFKARGNGTVPAPITLADYGSGALPQIVGVGEHEPAVLLQNVQNWIVRNLDQPPVTM